MSTTIPLPLEAWLEAAQKSKPHSLPTEGANYFQRYNNLKQKVADDYYRWTGSGAAARESGMLLTSHGPDHVNKVIKTLARLLDDDESCSSAVIGLDPYEVYIALCAIVLHDAGNALGRAGHEKQPFNILQSAVGLVDDSFEARFIADIASAHGGKVKGSPDTIGQTLRDTQEYKQARFRPKLIAALVRFADEVCEDKDRAASALLRSGTVPPESVIPHKYAEAIQSSCPDRRDKSVHIEYQLRRSDVEAPINGAAVERYLIDVIFERLDKMNKERIYCMRYMYPAAQMHRIRAQVYIVEDANLERIKCLDVDIGDGGYPDNAPSISAIYPDWCGNKLKDVIAKEGVRT